MFDVTLKKSKLFYLNWLYLVIFFKARTSHEGFRIKELGDVMRKNLNYLNNMLLELNVL